MSALPISPRSSTSSFEDGLHSPSHEFDSESALILVNGHEDTDAAFSSEDEERDDDDSFEQPTPPSIVPLSSITVFLYLLSPLLKLGALLSTFKVAHLPLKLALPGLFFFAALCAFSRQIWYMLSRYVRRTDIEEVFLETFARGRGRERRRFNIRMTVRFSTALLRVLLVAVYLRCTCSSYLFHSIHRQVFHSVRRRAGPLSPREPLRSATLRRHHSIGAVNLTPVLRTLTGLQPCTLPDMVISSNIHSMACLHGIRPCKRDVLLSHRITSAGPLAGTQYVYLLHPRFGRILIWSIGIITFTYSTSHTIPLYAALKGIHQPGFKSNRSRSFKILSVLSVVTATALIVPPTIFNSNSSPVSSLHFFK